MKGSKCVEEKDEREEGGESERKGGRNSVREKGWGE